MEKVKWNLDATHSSIDFFDVENHSKMAFNSTKISKKSPGEYEITGELPFVGRPDQKHLL